LLLLPWLLITAVVIPVPVFRRANIIWRDHQEDVHETVAARWRQVFARQIFAGYSDGSRFLRRTVLFDVRLKGPRHGLVGGLNGGRHTQDILTLCGGILHLDVAGYSLGVIVGQRDFVESSTFTHIQQDAAEFPHKSVSHALLHDPAHLDVGRTQEVITIDTLPG
jgi:hypothetical protein